LGVSKVRVLSFPLTHKLSSKSGGVLLFEAN
jgi:hypothetical protein